MRTSSSSGASPGAPREAFGAPGLRLVLASRSPQRDGLLRQLLVPFRVVVSAHVEDLHDGDPVRTVERNARGKAEEVLARTRLRAGELVLGVDTVVVAGGRVLGTAAGELEAAEYLRLLAGRRHEVYSGLHLCSAERAETAHASSTRAKVHQYRYFRGSILEFHLRCGFCAGLCLEVRPCSKAAESCDQ